MVRGRLTFPRFAGIALAGLLGCGKARDMPERVDMTDTMAVAQAIHDPKMADSMLDTVPGGEMAKGDSAAAMRLLKRKM